ncbi:MAG: DUF1080 domain-containing protein [Thermoguttaceae bacterium]|nr:DUF1080 domain-containing protein [Thermoguttaceae bacterium]MBQ2682975.1 DUF1080 domain-containing protein [Thermoguttaceae bacterium]MBQ6619896.1 DUF1080 domain-containing protein [Thermoguttaceae bacterium]
MKRSLFTFALALLLGAAFGMLRAEGPSAPEEGFTPLFNGQDLSGWRCDSKVWSAEDGLVVGRLPEKIAESTFLICEKPVKNFIIRFDYWISKEGNSGLQYRSVELPEGTPLRMSGYQADFDGAASYSGIVYEERGRGIVGTRGDFNYFVPEGQIVNLEHFSDNETVKSAIKIEDWNSYEVIAIGPYLEHRINGVTTARAIDLDPAHAKAEGLLGFQCHAGLVMEVKIRNMRIKEL